MCEGGKEEAEKKMIARRPKTMGNRPSNQPQALLELGCGAGRVAVF